MKLYKAKEHSNTYDLGHGNRQTTLSNYLNVKSDINGNLKPSDNRLIRRDHPVVEFLVKQGPFEIGFHKKATNKYMSAIRLYTGETLVKTAINDIACTPIIENNHTIKWLYGNGSWIKEVATERQIKETVFQKKDQVIKFKYELSGFTVKNEGKEFDIYKGNKVAFSIKKPYYMTSENGDFDGWVDYGLEKIDGDYIMTYPAQGRDRYIDPTIIFGEGAGQTGGDHKDNWVRGSITDKAHGGDTDFRVGDLPGGSGTDNRYGLIRFSLSSHIPVNAVVTSGILTLALSVGAFQTTNHVIYRLNKAWGITPTNEGASQATATQGQATFRRSFDFDGSGGDVAWGGGSFALANDAGPVLQTWTVNTAHLAGQSYNIDITADIQADVLNDATNYGKTIYTTSPENATNVVNYATQESATVARRPYLTVVYTVPGVAQFFFFNDDNKRKFR